MKKYIWSIVSISAFVGLVLAFFKGFNNLTLFESLKLLPTIVSIDLIIISVFIQWGWRFKVFLKFFNKVDLNGKWEGYIRSTFRDPDTGEIVSPIPAKLNIKQNFLNISCVMITNEMRSRSNFSNLIIDSDKQIKQLCYTYDSFPSLTLVNESPRHYGTVIFEITEKHGISLSLKGQYWTSRYTLGEISLIKK